MEESEAGRPTSLEALLRVARYTDYLVVSRPSYTESIRRAQISSSKRGPVLRELYGGLWHTIHPERFEAILASGALLPDPEVPDGDRWGTSQGPDYYPYVRTLGGISLFDFDQFDAETYSERCPNSSWCEFVPYQQHWGCSVWIEIDRIQAGPQLISGPDLVARWKADSAYGHNIMPYIEAAHLGPLPRTAFKRAFLVREEDDQFNSLDV